MVADRSHGDIGALQSSCNVVRETRYAHMSENSGNDGQELIARGTDYQFYCLVSKLHPNDKPRFPFP